MNKLLCILIIFIGLIGCRVNREEMDIGFEVCNDHLGLSSITTEFFLQNTRYYCKDGTSIGMYEARQSLSNPGETE